MRASNWKPLKRFHIMTPFRNQCPKEFNLKLGALLLSLRFSFFSILELDLFLFSKKFNTKKLFKF